MESVNKEDTERFLRLSRVSYGLLKLVDKDDGLAEELKRIGKDVLSDVVGHLREEVSGYPDYNPKPKPPNWEGCSFRRNLGSRRKGTRHEERNYQDDLYVFQVREDTRRLLEKLEVIVSA